MSFETRIARFNLMLAMRHGLPPYEQRMSLQQVADELVRLGHEPMTRERVRQILQEPPKPRPGTDPARQREELERRLERWAARGTARGDARADACRTLLEQRQS